MRTSVLPLVALGAAKLGLADCECGYTVNATDSEYFTIFTELLEADFLHIEDLSRDTDNAWIPQAYNVTPANADGPYGKASMVENVVTNPIRSQYDWNSPGINSEDPGLQLWVKNDLMLRPGTDNDSMVPMAEIVSARDDILYGSFRIGMRTTRVNGTCGAFFFYLNDTEEIDMEFLSKQQDVRSGFVNLVIQSPASAATGYVNEGSPDFDEHSVAFAPQAQYREYRFDWLPDRVDFYADGELLSTITENIPDAAGSIHISHWSNGNPGWSAGPPEENAVLTVSYVKAYFNSSDPEVTEKSLPNCKIGTEAREDTCQIPDQKAPPDPSGTNGNETGRTFFFTHPSEPVETSPVTPMNSTNGPLTSAGRQLSAKGGLLPAMAGAFTGYMLTSMAAEDWAFVFRALYFSVAGLSVL